MDSLFNRHIMGRSKLNFFLLINWQHISHFLIKINSASMICKNDAFLRFQYGCHVLTPQPTLTITIYSFGLGIQEQYVSLLANQPFSQQVFLSFFSMLVWKNTIRQVSEDNFSGMHFQCNLQFKIYIGDLLHCHQYLSCVFVNK